MSEGEDPRICDEGGKGMLFPLEHYDWHPVLQAILYSLGLIYSFLGVAIVSDLFMASIEAITKRRTQRKTSSGRVVTSLLWNQTVANLSLMALGSSAPEIFLSLIDLIRKGMHAGDLGSSTIVGSAAFNLLVIVAVCVMCIPEGEQRVIEQYSVFIVTAIFSLVAYLWLAAVLVVITPDVVDLWEAIVTLLFLPVLIYVSYLADIGRIKAGAHLILGPASAEETGEEAEKAAEDEAAPAGKDTGDGESLSPRPATPAELQATKATKTKGEAIRASETSSADCRAYSRTSSEAENSEAGMRASQFSFFGANSESETASSGAKARDSFKNLSKLAGSEYSAATTQTSKSKVQFKRGFTVQGLSGDDLDDIMADRKSRGKSIAAHHRMATNRLRKSVSRCSTSLGDLGMALKNGERVSYLDDAAEHVTVQMLIDRQYICIGMEQKEVKVSRRGAKFPVRITYSVVVCGETVPDISDYEVVTAFDVQPYEIGDEVDWSSSTWSEEVATGTAVMQQDQEMLALNVDVPPPISMECFDFCVILKHVEAIEDGVGKSATLGKVRSTYVSQTSEQLEPRLTFATPTLWVPGKDREQVVEVVIVRLGNCEEAVECDYETEGLSAVPGYDFVERSSRIKLKIGETETTVQISMQPKLLGRAKRDLLLVLKSPEDGDTKFAPADDGGGDSAIATITIGPEETGARPLLKLVDQACNINSFKRGFSVYGEQFVCALFVNGSLAEQKEASLSDWIFHIVSLPWMLTFAVIPPTEFCGGWVCFCTCLGFIAGVTIIIADFAEIFGCILDVPDVITAITFVALGTSMPDLFASKVAATEDPTADASVVNVTGSNSVNVFLGLGLPWILATVYWSMQDRDAKWIAKYPEVNFDYPGTAAVFVVPAGNLGFCVIIFCLACLAALVLLVQRRRVLGTELGGPKGCKVAAAVTLVCYWVGYLVAASWRALRWGKESLLETVGVIGGLAIVEIAITAWPFFMLREEARRRTADADFEEAARPAAEKAGAAEATGQPAAVAVGGGGPAPEDAAAALEDHDAVRACELERVHTNGSIASVPTEPQTASVLCSTIHTKRELQRQY